MHTMRSGATSLFLMLLSTAWVGTAMAGNLNPSAPPTTGTMKPLDQVEPRIPISAPGVISSSGSYYLTKNITSTGTGINISADDVTLDLCGFTLAGPGSGLTYGIYINGTKNIEIRNGTIKNFGLSGIQDALSSGNNRRIINMRVVNNGRFGIYLSGATAGGDLVKDCLVSGNGTSYTSTVYGIYLTSHCIVSGNLVHNNGNATLTSAYGISVGTGSVVTGNTVRTNYGYGITATTSCRITDNTVTDNRNSGITAGDNCTIQDNIVSSNSLVGIFADNHCAICGNTVISNSGNGISADNDCTISGNTVNSNSDGIQADDHVTITDNTVSSNRASGINCVGGTIARNTVSLNNTVGSTTWGGIVVANHSQIKDNTLEGNSKNNIYVTGFRNSVEGNVMSGSDYGINFTTSGNLFLNNRASSNGINYNFGSNTNGGGNFSF